MDNNVRPATMARIDNFLLYYGDKVTVLETVTVDGVDWGRIEQGWICMDYVS